MSCAHVALLSLSFGLCGCESTFHGPVTRVISNKTRTDHIGADGTGGINRVLVTESRLSDEKGREWTESAIVAIEPVPGGLPQIEAELFQEAEQKWQQGETSVR